MSAWCSLHSPHIFPPVMNRCGAPRTGVISKRPTSWRLRTVLWDYTMLLHRATPGAEHGSQHLILHLSVEDSKTNHWSPLVPDMGRPSSTNDVAGTTSWCWKQNTIRRPKSAMVWHWKLLVITSAACPWDTSLGLFFLPYVQT